MSPDGATVTQPERDGERPGRSAGRGRCCPPRRSSSSTLVATGARGAGLQTATFDGNVDYREGARRAREAGGGRRESPRRSTLIVDTKPGFGALEQADFRGNVHFTDGPSPPPTRTRALYHVDRDRLDLSPSTAIPVRPPRVSDGSSPSQARTIELSLGPRSSRRTPTSGARCSARRRHTRRLPPPEAGWRGAVADAPAPSAARARLRVPSMLKAGPAGERHLQPPGLRWRRRTAIYTGNARLWQAETKVHGRHDRASTTRPAT